MSAQPAFNFDQRTASRFLEFHAQHPEIYEYFKRFTFEKINAGATRVGSKSVWERIRWESPIKKDGSEYALNNTLTPFYARLFMRDFPRHSNLFETRKSKADSEV